MLVITTTVTTTGFKGNDLHKKFSITPSVTMMTVKIQLNLFSGQEESMKSGLAAKVKHIDGKLIGKDGKSLKVYRRGNGLDINQFKSGGVSCMMNEESTKHDFVLKWIWRSQIKQNWILRMILESVEQGPLLWPSVEVEGVTRLSELLAAEAIQADCDVKATNIILQGLPESV
nr:hypothetical protein [Tanacetum cinerariifolium]